MAKIAPLKWWVYFVPAHTENLSEKDAQGNLVDRRIEHPDQWKAGCEGVTSDMPPQEMRLGPYSPDIAPLIARELTEKAIKPAFLCIPTEVEVSEEKAEKREARADARASQTTLDI